MIPVYQYNDIIRKRISIYGLDVANVNWESSTDKLNCKVSLSWPDRYQYQVNAHILEINFSAEKAKPYDEASVAIIFQAIEDWWIKYRSPIVEKMSNDEIGHLAMEIISKNATLICEDIAARLCVPPNRMKIILEDLEGQNIIKSVKRWEMK